jgi:thioredoxin reductase
MESHDVVIVGGGPTGLGAAAASLISVIRCGGS